MSTIGERFALPAKSLAGQKPRHDAADHGYREKNKNHGKRPGRIDQQQNYNNRGESIGDDKEETLHSG